MHLSRTPDACREWLAALALVACSLAAASAVPAEEGRGRSAAEVSKRQVAKVLAHLGSPQPAERLGAAKRLPELAIELWTQDFDPTHVVILTALDDTEPEVRQMAAVSLYQATSVIWGNLELPADREAVLDEASGKLRRLHPQLVDRLDDDDPIVREYLLRSLGSWMPNVPEGLSDHLVDVVDDPSLKVARLALRVLGRAGECSQAVLSTVLGALEDRPELRATAAGVLAELYGQHTETGCRAPASADLLDSLSAAAADPDEAVQLAVLRALGHVGAGSESVRALLQAHADSEHEPLRLEADRALGLLDAHGPSGGDAEEP